MEIYFCALMLIVSYGSAYQFERNKRDDGAFLTNSGGPVAQESEGQSGGNKGIPAELQAELAKLDPCESNLVKGQQGSNGNNFNSGKRFQPNLSPRSPRFAAPQFGPLPFGPRPVGPPQSPQFPPQSQQSAPQSQQSAPPQSKEPSGSSKLQEIKADAEKKFKEFMSKFNKSYPTKDDMDKALGFFKENLEKLYNMLKQRRSPFDASFVTSKFMDMNFDAFKSVHLGALPPLNDAKALTVNVANLVTRDCKQLNWTSLDVIPSVRKQDKCGCCYAMSTADMVAAQYNIDRKNYSKLALSPQWLADCMQAPGGYKCNGGRPVKILEELANKTKWRIPTEDCYPYKDANGTCTATTNCKNTPPIQVRWGKMVSIEGSNEKELMAALLQHGPVVAIVSVTDSWQMYNGTGIIRPYQCVGDQNHAVLVTGYDYTSCVASYTIKNSWGTDWGGKGYIRLEAGKNTCNIAKSLILTCTTPDCLKQDPLKYVLSNSKHPACK